MPLIKRVKINLLCSFVFDQQIFTMLEKQAVAKANSSPWINFQKNNNWKVLNFVFLSCFYDLPLQLLFSLVTLVGIIEGIHKLFKVCIKKKYQNLDENIILQKRVQFDSKFHIFLDKVSGKNMLRFQQNRTTFY